MNNIVKNSEKEFTSDFIDNYYNFLEPNEIMFFKNYFHKDLPKSYIKSVNSHVLNLFVKHCILYDESLEGKQSIKGAIIFKEYKEYQAKMCFLFLKIGLSLATGFSNNPKGFYKEFESICSKKFNLQFDQNIKPKRKMDGQHYKKIILKKKT